VTRLLLLALCLAASSTQAQQPYPSKAVRVIVPYPPGSTPDIVGRTLADRLQKSLGQPFIVENRTGAGGNIGTDLVAKSPPDGHTLLVAINGPIAVNKHLYKNLPYDPDRDLQPISLLASAPQMLIMKQDLKVDDFKSFIQQARQNPGRWSYGSAGSGSASHLTMELLKSDARVYVVHIPYRGFPPALTDLLGGSIEAMFAIIPAVLPQVRAGRVKALAVTSLKRSVLAPDVPSVAELGYPQLESLAWIGLLAPTGTSREIISRLSVQTVQEMQGQDVRDALGKQGFDVVASSPEEFSRWIRLESDKWAKVIRASGATPD
jgi:tripartite-type tricarboxylate transporter receptor subunit TctC